MARVNGITQFLPATHTTILTSLRKHSPDGATWTRRHTFDIAYYSIYRPRKDERLSWPSWLTYSGRFAHISGHPSAIGRAWDRRSNHCASQPTKAVCLLCGSVSVRMITFIQYELWSRCLVWWFMLTLTRSNSYSTSKFKVTGRKCSFSS